MPTRRGRLRFFRRRCRSLAPRASSWAAALAVPLGILVGLIGLVFVAAAIERLANR